MKLLLIFLTSTTLFAAESCQDLVRTAGVERKSITELKALQDELQEKFKGFVDEDFSALVEGMNDALAHHEAIKAAFARKKLAKKMQERTHSYNSFLKSFCGQCKDLVESNDGKRKYCTHCTEEPHCS